GRVDALLEGGRVELEDVVLAGVADRLDGLDSAGRAADLVGGVEHRALRTGHGAAAAGGAVGPLDHGVAGDAHHAGLLVALVDMHDHRGVGAGAALVPAVGAVLARPGVRAHHEDVHRAVVDVLGPVAAQGRVDVD